MKKFEYLQVKYSEYPSTEQLNVVGVNGWELIHINIIKSKIFDSILESFYEKKIYQATFKKEINDSNEIN